MTFLQTDRVTGVGGGGNDRSVLAAELGCHIVGEPVGLFEFLGVVVERVGEQDGEGTRSTFTNAETFDDDGCVAMEWQPIRDGTRHTSNDDETFDDDQFDLTLCQPDPGHYLHTTVITRTEPETYDDNPGADSLAVPATLALSADSTIFTKTDPETFDDDPATSGLSIPGG